jgi:succinate dehydrogenase / fumarate reductase membrane anchor subunit
MDTVMSKKSKSLRTPLGKVRGLGSAREGTHHWWRQRLTALALIPLSLVIMGSFFNAVVFGDGYSSAIGWLSSPFAAVVVILSLGVGFHHAASGVQVVIEDYVHGEALKLTSIIIVKFAAVSLALLGAIAVIKILFFSLPPLPPSLPHV